MLWGRGGGGRYGENFRTPRDGGSARWPHCLGPGVLARAPVSEAQTWQPEWKSVVFAAVRP